MAGDLSPAQRRAVMEPLLAEIETGLAQMAAEHARLVASIQPTLDALDRLRHERELLNELRDMGCRIQKSAGAAPEVGGFLAGRDLAGRLLRVFSHTADALSATHAAIPPGESDA
jgi:hypothetical protein